jgi:hypothetical protein
MNLASLIRHLLPPLSPFQVITLTCGECPLTVKIVDTPERAEHLVSVVLEAHDHFGQG